MTGMVPLLGSSELICASLARARTGRALLASAVIAGALTLAGCNTDDVYQLPTRAMKELSPEMISLLEKKNMPKDSPVLVRVFKEESELEVWKQDSTGRFELLKVYPICRWSGELGPKVREGDRQAPEGFYSISPGLMNPNSNYYLAINMGFPNAYDKANGRSGAFLMIHGDCSSRGCYAMTDEQIGEIYSLAREAFLGGQKAFQIQAYPFRMTPANLARHRNNPNMPFWKMIKEGNDHFLVTHMEPKVDVCERHYVFDAQAPANSTKALSFSPSGHCPRFDVPKEIAEPALDKQRNDEYQVALMTRANVATAPIKMGTDGGMNRVFVAKLEDTSVIMDNDGHPHAPPVQAGRPMPTISGPPTSEADATATTPKTSTVSGFIGNLFASNSSSAPSNTSTDSQSRGFFGNLFGSKSDKPKDATAPADTAAAPPAAPYKPKTPARSETALAAAHPKPKADPQKNETQEAQAPAPKAQPQKQANASAPPAGGDVMKGAQAPIPSGSFDNRWGGLQ
jgi:murein L,D-transpeptidase YafK